MRGFRTTSTEIFHSNKDVRVVLRTSNRILVDCHAVHLEVEDARGRFGIDSRTDPTMVALVPSELVVHKRDGSQLRVQVSWGSLTSVGNQVRIVARKARVEYVDAMPMPIAV